MLKRMVCVLSLFVINLFVCKCLSADVCTEVPLNYKICLAL